MICGYFDSDNSQTWKSASDLCVFINGNLITWWSKKKDSVSRSSVEAEYKALTSLAMENKWTSFICKDLGYPIYHVPTLYSNNNFAIFMTNNPVIRQKSKHIKIDVHFVRELISKNYLKLLMFGRTHVCSPNQIDDFFTKAVSNTIFTKLCRKLNMKFCLWCLDRSKN